MLGGFGGGRESKAEKDAARLDAKRGGSEKTSARGGGKEGGWGQVKEGWEREERREDGWGRAAKTENAQGRGAGRVRGEGTKAQRCVDQSTFTYYRAGRIRGKEVFILLF